MYRENPEHNIVIIGDTCYIHEENGNTLWTLKLDNPNFTVTNYLDQTIEDAQAEGEVTFRVQMDDVRQGATTKDFEELKKEISKLEILRKL